MLSHREFCKRLQGLSSGFRYSLPCSRDLAESIHCFLGRCSRRKDPCLCERPKKDQDRFLIFDGLLPFEIYSAVFFLSLAGSIADMIRKQRGIKPDEVLVIHTDFNGDVRSSDLEELRKTAMDIDKTKNKVKIVVSVLMLREGWDVQNDSVILGLRPFTPKAEILPVQAVHYSQPLIPTSILRQEFCPLLSSRHFFRMLRSMRPCFS